MKSALVARSNDVDVNCVLRLGEAAANGAATRNYVKYSEELFTEMMELHAGGVSIPRICERPGMPCVTSLAKPALPR